MDSTFEREGSQSPQNTPESSCGSPVPSLLEDDPMGEIEVCEGASQLVEEAEMARIFGNREIREIDRQARAEREQTDGKNCVATPLTSIIMGQAAGARASGSESQDRTQQMRFETPEMQVAESPSPSTSQRISQATSGSAVEETLGSTAIGWEKGSQAVGGFEGGRTTKAAVDEGGEEDKDIEMVDEAVGRFARRLAQEEYQNFGGPTEEAA